MAYSIAFVLLGLGLLAGYRFALRDPAAPPSAVANRTAPESGETPVVPPIQTGKITAMKDCQWADPASAAKEMRAGKFALASGIVATDLQLRREGQLKRSRPLRLERPQRRLPLLRQPDDGHGEQRRQAGVRRAQKPQASDYPPFTIRTPTTIVNDQGCRCAVTVDERGTASVRVFRGRVFLLSPDARCKDVTCLGEGDFAWTEIRNGRESSSIPGPGSAARRPSSRVRPSRKRRSIHCTQRTEAEREKKSGKTIRAVPKAHDITPQERRMKQR